MLHDDLDDVGKADLDRLTASAMGVRGPKVHLADTVNVKLGRRPKPKIKWEWEPQFESGGLNRDIEVTVRIPAYMVAALKTEGELNAGVREAVRDWLVKKDLDKTFMPRFRAAIMAEVIDSRNRFTRTVARGRFTD